MILFGTPQRGLPWIPAIPNTYYLTIVDIKDFFFSITLHPDDMEKFAFSLPSTNFHGPDWRFEWSMLPQGMTSKQPTPMCQYYMLHIFSSLMEHPNILFYIYMDDIILGSPTLSSLCHLTANCLTILIGNDFKVAPDKVQSIPPFEILGSICPLIWFLQPNPNYTFRISTPYLSSKSY